MVRITFLREEFVLMVGKGQWVVLTYSVARELPGLRIRPHVKKEERDQKPRWIGGYSYSNINSNSLTISTLYIIHYEQDLYRLIRYVVIEDPALGPIYVLKEYVSNGFYHIKLRPADMPKLGLVFPLDGKG